MRTHIEGESRSERARTGVLVVARVRLYREGLVHTLAAGGYDVVGAVPDLAGGLAALAEFEPDVVVMDASHPEALVEIERMARCRPQRARILALGIPPREEAILACAESGAAGFVTTADPADGLLDAVARVARGELRCCERTAAALFRRLGELATRATVTSPGRLTAREREIARLIALGLTNREIAARLSIELTTVKNHVHNILAKLGARARSEIGLGLLETSASATPAVEPDLDPVPGT